MKKKPFDSRSVYKVVHDRWKEIKQRTRNPSNEGYKNYGGRGIDICQEWYDSFELFYQHIGPPASLALTVERIDNNSDYKPGNVRWATYAEQLINQRGRKNKHGTGVRKTKDTYWAMITIRGKRIYLGSFKRASDARRAYLEAKGQYAVQLTQLSNRSR